MGRLVFIVIRRPPSLQARQNQEKSGMKTLLNIVVVLVVAAGTARHRAWGMRPLL